MTTTQPTVRTVSIRVSTRGVGDLPGFLDMLRYDQPTVLDWDRKEDVYTVTLRFEKFYTPDRWASFALYPKEVEYR